MIKVDIVKQANYPVSTPLLKRRLREFLRKKGIVSNARVEVALVNEEKMKKIDRRTHDVLSFVPDEAKQKFIYPPDGTIYLGEIVVCFPLVLKEANQEGKLIEDKVYELIEHGACHLLGEHHE